VISVWRE